MKLFVRNEDQTETILLQGIPKVVDDKFGIFGENPKREAGSRMVLRPGEENTFTLEEGYILALEQL